MQQLEEDHDFAFAVCCTQLTNYGQLAYPGSQAVAVVRVFWSEAEAAAEVDRLREAYGGLCTHYFRTITRVQRKT